jgi:PAS domain S-box-containing protein
VNPVTRATALVPFLRYGVAAASVAAAVLLTLALPPVRDGAPFLFFFAAVAVSAWSGGRGPGLLAALASAASVEYWIVSSAAAVSGENALRLVMFVGVAFLLATLQRRHARGEDARHASQSELRAILDHTAAVVYLKALDGRYLVVNRRFEELFHLSEAEARGKTSHDLFPTPMADRFRANDRRALEAGEPIEFEETVPQDDGLHTYISIKFPVRDPEGRVYAVCGISTDITARRRAEDELRQQREWLRVTLTSIGDAVIATDRAGRVIFMNPVAEALTGWTQDLAAGHPLEEVFRIVNEDTGNPVENPAHRVLKDGKVVGLANHTVLLARDGREIPIDDSGAPIRDAGGEVTGVVLVFRDVRERRQRDARTRFLAEAGRVLSSSLDYDLTLNTLARLAVPVLADWCIVHILEADGGLRRLQTAYADPAKADVARRLEGHYGRLATTDFRSPAHRLIRVMRSGEPELVPSVTADWLDSVSLDPEHRRLLKELAPQTLMHVPLVIRGRPLGVITCVRTDAGHPYGDDDLALAQELARRGAVAVENAQLFREALIANRAKDEFLATLSHELRTPLNAMLGWTRMLRTGMLDASTAARAVDVIERNTKLQAQLIEDLLDVSRIITGKLRIELRPVNLAQITEQALESVRSAAEARAISLETDLDTDRAIISGDPDRLQQVVWNLLSNAIKFTPPGGRVLVSLRPVNSCVRLEVRDSGPGIHPEFLPHVFERFRQADSSSTRQHGGLGLGLAIVRHLVDAHGGVVRADNAPEGGAVFSVEFPIFAAASVAPAVELPAGAPADVPVMPAVLQGLKILVVEDEPDARDLLVTILSEWGAETIAADGGVQALAVFDHQAPDVIVSDIGLPGMDGYELIRRIRARPAEQSRPVPAVALTAYARAEDRRMALLAGFDMHVAKPIEPAALVAAIASLARTSRTGH